MIVQLFALSSVTLARNLAESLRQDIK